MPVSEILSEVNDLWKFIDCNSSRQVCESKTNNKHNSRRYLNIQIPIAMEYSRPDRSQTMLLLIMIVLIACPSSAHGQSYLFSLENVLNESSNRNLTSANGTTEVDLFPEAISNNTRIIVYKNTVVESSNELSQTAMDVITIVWYVATFLALAAFFMLMACSDRRCRDMRRRPAGGQSTEGLRAPPTPSPSYSEFAPPSYDTVIKMQHAAKTSVFVIPFNNKGSEVEAPPPPPTPLPASPLPPSITCNVFTVNELQKSAN